MRLVDIDSIRYNGGPECPPWVSLEQLEEAASGAGVGGELAVENEKKLEVLKKHIPVRVDGLEDLYQAYMAGIDALEKRVPQAVKRQKESGNISCPWCGCDILFSPLSIKSLPVTYCCRCGQALDWSEE